MALGDNILQRALERRSKSISATPVEQETQAVPSQISLGDRLRDRLAGVGKDPEPTLSLNRWRELSREEQIIPTNYPILSTAREASSLTFEEIDLISQAKNTQKANWLKANYPEIYSRDPLTMTPDEVENYSRILGIVTNKPPRQQREATLEQAPPPTILERAIKPLRELVGESRERKIARSQIKLEAKEQGFPKDVYVDLVNPMGAPIRDVERFLSQIGGGIVGTLGGLVGAVDRGIATDITRELSNRIYVWEKEEAPDDPGLADQLANALGSSALYIPVFGATNSLTSLLKLTPKTARYFGMSLGGVVESMVESGRAYQDMMVKTGGDRERSAEAADAVFISNLPLNAITNKLGIFSEGGGLIKRLVAAGIEGGQEAAQDAIQALSKGETQTLSLKGLATTAAIGSVTGGLLKGIGDVSLPKTQPEPLKIEKKSLPVESAPPSVPDIANASVKEAGVLDKTNRLFTRFVGHDETTQQQLINISEIKTRLREEAAKNAVNLTQGFNKNQIEEVYRNLQEPEKYSLEETVKTPEKELANKLLDISRWQFLEHNKRALNEKEYIQLEEVYDRGLPMPEKLKPKLILQMFPQNQIDNLTSELGVLEFKKNRSSNEAYKSEIQVKQDEIRKRIQALEGVRYFHQITYPENLIKKVGRRVGKIISRRPRAFLGRSFPTRQAAIEAGREVGGLTTAIADVIFETNNFIAMDEFIKNINRNPEFALTKNAPEGWVKIDEKLFPSGKAFRYDPNIAEALEEITYTSNKNELTKAYDKINSMIKIVGFYNPLFMGRYNISQGLRLGGIKHLTSYPEAIRIWRERGDTYWNLQENGLFNNVFDMQPAMEDVVKQVQASINKAPISQRFKEVAKNNLNPLNLIKNSWDSLNKSTWKIDEVQRIASWLSIKDNIRLNKKYSAFGIIELVNDFHANYAKVPKATRETLNRAIFTPTYKISMARAVARMHKEAPELWPQLLRHYAIKMALKTWMPAALGLYLKWRGSEKTVEPKDYRVILREPGQQDTVFSLSDPLLEATKVLNRPIDRTIEYNLAAVPNAIAAAVRGPLFYKRDSSFYDVASAFFKTGIPGIKDLQVWRDTDKETYQKFMQFLGLAFIYKRNPEVLPENEGAKYILQAMDLWIDFSKMKPSWLQKKEFPGQARRVRPTTSPRRAVRRVRP